MIATWSCAPPRAPTPASPANGPNGAPVSIAPKYSARASGLAKTTLHASSSVMTVLPFTVLMIDVFRSPVM